MMIIHEHNTSMPLTDSNFPNSAVSPSREEQLSTLKALREQLVARYRPVIQQGSGPIRMMARMIAELEQECREHHLDDEVMRAGIVNRTIGDVDLRRVTECEGEPGGTGDYRLLADELGVALPGEQISGYTATGDTYLWLRQQMQECERLLLDQRYDVRMYDIYGIGNPLLRRWLAEDMQRKWGIPVVREQVYLGLGAMDSIDKVLRALRLVLSDKGIEHPAALFPEPGFSVPEWQARSFGYRLHQVQTTAGHSFKVSTEQLEEALSTSPDIHVIYLTVTNNPTTFAYNAQELTALFDTLRPYWQQGRPIYILADMAYIGTAQDQSEDRARMTTFTPPDVLQHTIFINSFSKVYSLTGERLGYVAIGDASLAPLLIAAWTNSNASLPGEWQLRYMAYYRLLSERPWLADKLRAFYRLRRDRLVSQLNRINREQPLFRAVYLGDDATVYNWSQLAEGEDAFSLFEKTGIAGVPGSGFGYTDDYIRFSIGVIPVSED
jgi:aspartate/methionine/tyrosine aminotransferase